MLCSPLDFKRQLYLANVRSILEYCSPMWSPSHVNDTIKLERVQIKLQNSFSVIMFHPKTTKKAQRYLSRLCASVEY